MRRKIYRDLLNWKNDTHRKPLILKGARQVGKSWILKEFGKNEFEYTAYISCDNEPLIEQLFSDFDIKRILLGIEAITKQPVVAGKTLIIFDEIQEIQKGLTALKYFCEEAPEYHVAVAGSLLGITLNQGKSFPVGKVDFLSMFPMDFEEFLWAIDETLIARYISEGEKQVITSLQDKCIGLLRQYYFCGGMPESVKIYTEEKSVLKVREVQKSILEAYKNDISKHSSVRESERIHLVLRSLPSQLARENKKFIYSAIRKGARASEFEVAIQWLVDAGIVEKVSRINTVKHPLTFYEDFNAFKLYLLDCGLFGAMAGADPSAILMGSKIFEEYKGAFSELYVLQQLSMALRNENIFYYSGENSEIEIDFVTQLNQEICSIEVKAEGNVKGKAIKIFNGRYNILQSIRFSMLPYRKQETIVNIPLYAAFALPKWI